MMVKLVLIFNCFSYLVVDWNELINCFFVFIVCQIFIDLVFVFFVFLKINDIEWCEVQNFVKGIVNVYNIFYQGIYVGVLFYLFQVIMEMKFNWYFYVLDVLNVIDNIYSEVKSYKGICMDDVLEIVNYELFIFMGGLCEQIVKVMIVLVLDFVVDVKS